ncbi:MAG: NifU family protein, partial [Thermosynechococcaceae cyanobacterium]
ALPWQEFAKKLSFMPRRKQLFRAELLRAQLSPALLQGLLDLEVLNPTLDQDLVQELKSTDRASENALDDKNSDTFSELIHNSAVSTETKVHKVIERYITPVLENDGGMIELLNFDGERGEVTVRFLGSCANCPSSLLSVETIVKPPLLSIPGVYHVVHRTHLQAKELQATGRH